MPSTKNVIDPVEPTAAKAVVPTNWPTMMLSTMLYSCWKTVPTNSGRLNRSSFPAELPVVIS